MLSTDEEGVALDDVGVAGREPHVDGVDWAGGRVGTSSSVEGPSRLLDARGGCAWQWKTGSPVEVLGRMDESPEPAGPSSGRAVVRRRRGPAGT